MFCLLTTYYTRNYFKKNVKKKKRKKQLHQKSFAFDQIFVVHTYVYLRVCVYVYVYVSTYTFVARIHLVQGEGVPSLQAT